MPRVEFEPIGEEIECGHEETVLDAAFRAGYSLVYGCREGQCSACKSYLLEGEVVLKPYSTFALSDTEEAQGYTLLCRAMPEDDLVVELLHYDPDNYRLELPIRKGSSRILEIEELTHDITRLLLEIEEPADFDFRPGNYVDLEVPGSDERRSFSIANLPGDGRIELIIKRYEGGRFSGLLDGELEVGSKLGFEGPYGAFYLRESDRPILMVAGGSGMAPQLGLLRELAAARSERQVRYFYGARARRDLFYTELVAELGAELPDFEFVPVLSEPDAADGWQGETGFVHEAVDRFLRTGGLGGEPDAYLCGPPPMVDATIESLVDGHGFDEARIHYDKFTTTAAGDGSAA